MKTLVIGIGDDNSNYKKIYGFLNAFSKIGDLSHEKNYPLDSIDGFRSRRASGRCEALSSQR